MNGGDQALPRLRDRGQPHGHHAQLAHHDVDRGLKQVKYMCQVQNFIYEIQLV